MTLKFTAILAGCMLVVAAGAAYHRAEVWSAPSARATELPPPLFVQAATLAPSPAPAAWPPSGSVAFFKETFALLTTAATQSQPAPGATPQVARLQVPPPDAPPPSPPVRDAGTFGMSGAPAPQRPGVMPPAPPGVTSPAHNDNTVEVVVRDRFGRPIRIVRIDRRQLAGGGAYPPPQRPYGAPYGAYGPYGPYGPYRQ